ncbi:MAG: heme o synthase [Chitinophagales bacterium]
MQSRIASFGNLLGSKISIYSELAKFRLSSFVILSSMIGYLFANLGNPVDWVKFLLFTIGGTLVTFASNAINQVIEKDSDRLMRRTMIRPLPENRVSTSEVILFIGVSAVAGLTILSFSVNAMTALIAAISLLLYGFIYTPLKKISSLAVFVGAIPGAFPPLLGYVAYSNGLNEMAIWLFVVQFFWQFVHFWAIAWLGYDDYLKAGIMLLPSDSGKSKASAGITFIYALVLIPLALFPYFIYNKITTGIIILLIGSIWFSYRAFVFYKEVNDIQARKLMFASFIYLLVFFTSLFFHNQI